MKANVHVSPDDWVAILDAMSEGVAIVDHHDCLRHANRAFYELIKQPYGAGVGQPLGVLLHPQRKARPCIECVTRQRGRPARFKLQPFESTNPTGRTIEVAIEPVRDASGTLIEVVEMMRDLTDVERSERRLVQLFESAADGILLQDPHTFALLDANQRACELFGYAKSELVITPFARLVADNQLDEVQAALAHLRQSGAMRLETTITRKDGLQVPVEVSARLITANSDPVVQVILRDVTERRMVEHVLRERGELAQQLAEAQLRVQEDERRHLARELHDGVGQTLSALKFRLEVLRYKQAEEAHASLPELSHAVGRAVDALRNLAMHLRPSQLDDLGLVQTLRWHTAQLAQQTGLQITFESTHDQCPLPTDVCVHLYRIAQEALTNACKHAQASAMAVQLRNGGGAVELTICDNGRGFDPAGVRQEAGQFHVGLSSMRERAAMIHGELSITSAPGQGTTITVRVPLPEGHQP